LKCHLAEAGSRVASPADQSHAIVTDLPKPDLFDERREATTEAAVNDPSVAQYYVYGARRPVESSRAAVSRVGCPEGAKVRLFDEKPTTRPHGVNKFPERQHGISEVL
jgi:hypothetical protein